MSFQTPIAIAEAIRAIETNQFVLPAIQREFVWSSGQITRLFDSLMWGYPIGSFLFWHISAENVQNYQYYQFMHRYHQRDHRHNEPITLSGNHDVTAVLDGQQRLTAINIGLKGTYADSSSTVGGPALMRFQNADCTSTSCPVIRMRWSQPMTSECSVRTSQDRRRAHSGFEWAMYSSSSPSRMSSTTVWTTT